MGADKDVIRKDAAAGGRRATKAESDARIKEGNPKGIRAGAHSNSTKGGKNK